MVANLARNRLRVTFSSDTSSIWWRLWSRPWLIAVWSSSRLIRPCSNHYNEQIAAYFLLMDHTHTANILMLYTSSSSSNSSSSSSSSSSRKKFSLTLPWVVLFSDSQDSTRVLGVWEHVRGLAPFLGGRSSAAQPHWLFPVFPGIWASSSSSSSSSSSKKGGKRW